VSDPRVDTTPVVGWARRHPTVIVLWVLWAVVTVGWVTIAAGRNRSPAPAAAAAVTPAPAETVEVWVAVKDLPVGTVLAKADLDKFAVKKKVPKDSVTAPFVVNEEEFDNKRLNRAVAKDEMFTPDVLGKGGITLSDGQIRTTIPLSLREAEVQFVTPGARVDLYATKRIHNKLETFPLFEGELVLSIDPPMPVVGDGDESRHQVTFALTPKQEQLYELAKQRGCHLELRLRLGRSLSEYDIEKVRALLEAPEDALAVAPAPRVKPQFALPDGTAVLSLPFGPNAPAGGFIVPGSRVDLIAARKIDKKVDAFLLIVDVLVVAVDTRTDPEKPLESSSTVSLAVTKEQALVVALAKQNGHHIDLILRAPGAAANPEYDIKKVLAMLEQEAPASVAEPVPTAPAPRVKSDVALPEGTAVASFSVAATSAVGFIAPGGKLDVLATVRGEKTESFPLLVGVLVVAVDSPKDLANKTVSFAVTKEQAQLLDLAKARGCQVDLRLRDPSRPLDKDYDAEKVRKRLEELPEPGKKDD
jgi:Flp pilus assembly protein CpaB